MKSNFLLPFLYGSSELVRREQVIASLPMALKCDKCKSNLVHIGEGIEGYCLLGD